MASKGSAKIQSVNFAAGSGASLCDKSRCRRDKPARSLAALFSLRSQEALLRRSRLFRDPVPDSIHGGHIGKNHVRLFIKSRLQA